MFKQKKFQPYPQIRYAFSFTSLVAPFFLPTESLGQLGSSFTLPKKVKLKQSYLQLAWFFYMNKPDPTHLKRKVRLVLLPSKRKLYTLTKAPMAHKTNSKEQFNFKFYFFRAEFKTGVDKSLWLGSVNQSLFALLIFKNTFPTLDTNLLYLKSCRVSLPYHDSKFFSVADFKKS